MSTQVDDKKGADTASLASGCSAAGAEEARSVRREQEESARRRGEPSPVWFVRNLAPGEDVGSLHRKVLGDTQPVSLGADGYRGLYEW